jgi:hypothetical protein
VGRHWFGLVNSGEGRDAREEEERGRLS